MSQVKSNNNSQSSNSISITPLNDDWKIARKEFSQVVGKTVNLLMEGHGYSRDKAIDLVLREIGGPSLTDEVALNKVKQQYHMAHQPASRALVVSTAFQTIARASSSDDSPATAVEDLIKKLEKATFASKPESISTMNDSLEGKTKAPEIRLPQIAKTKPVIVVTTSSSSAKTTQRTKNHSSPSNHKRSKSATSSANNKPTKTKARKRTIEELRSSGNSQQTLTEDTTRPRADSVTEAVSAKLNQPQAPAEAKPSSNANAVRGKRTRGSSSLDEESSSTKRARSAA